MNSSIESYLKKNKNKNKVSPGSVCHFCSFLCKHAAMSSAGITMNHLEIEAEGVRGASAQPNSLCKQKQINSRKGCSVSSVRLIVAGLKHLSLLSFILSIVCQ